MHVAGKPSWIGSMLQGRQCPVSQIAMPPSRTPMYARAQHLFDPADKSFLDEKPTSSSTEVTRLYQPRQVTARKKDSFTTPGNWVTDELYNPTFLTGIFSRFPTQRTEHDGASAHLSSAALRLRLRIVAAA